MTAASSLIRFALIGALVVALGGGDSCPSLAVAPCAKSPVGLHNAGNCCGGEGCECDSACCSQESPARDKDQTTTPSSRDLRELAKVGSATAYVEIDDGAGQDLREALSLLSVSGPYSPTLFAQRTCLRV